jgi:hypothetical protein
VRTRLGSGKVVGVYQLDERLDDLVGGAPTPQMIAIQWRETR